MAYFPLFVDLKNKPIVVIGGGKVGYRKAKALVDYEANVKVISPKFQDEFFEMKNIELISREYMPGDIKGSYIAVIATSDREVNETAMNEAKTLNILVNVSDNPKESSFVFPATVRRGDVSIGISTSGGYPALSGELRKQIDEYLPTDLGEKLEKLKQSRK